MQPTSNATRMHHAALWFALLGGAVAWMGHFLAISIVAEWGYFAGLQRYRLLEFTAVTWAVFAATIAASAVALMALFVAWRLMQQAPRDPYLPHDTQSNARFMARFGLIANSVFLLIIIVETIPIAFFLRG